MFWVRSEPLISERRLQQSNWGGSAPNITASGLKARTDFIPPCQSVETAYPASLSTVTTLLLNATSDSTTNNFALLDFSMTRSHVRWRQAFPGFSKAGSAPAFASGNELRIQRPGVTLARSRPPC